MSISPLTAYNPTSSSLDRIPVQTLNQNDFLKLLVTQMSNQDPMNPQKDTEFIAQMAQFSALEQSKDMNAEMTRLRQEQQVLRADSLLGKSVELATDNNGTAAGLVTAVQLEAGTPKIIVNGQAYTLDQVLSITPATTNN